jgi:hypothetical protein
MASSGPNPPGTVGTSLPGTNDWSFPDNAKVEDAISTVASAAAIPRLSYYLNCTNFGFAIATGSTIDGIYVEVKRAYTGSNTTTHDNTIQLIVGGAATGNNKATATNWPNITPGWATYGGATDKWGLTPTVAQVNGSDFGVVVQAHNVASGKGVAASNVDFVRITVYYTAGGAPAAFVSQVRQNTLLRM